MVLFVKQKVFSLGDRFTVKDPDGTDRWEIRGDLFSFVKRLHVYDHKGLKEHLEVRQVLWSFMPRFLLIAEGRTVAVVRQRFAWFKDRFEVEGTDCTIEGDLSEHRFTVNRHGQVLMTVRKEWFSWGDSFRLDITDLDSEVFCLGLVLAVDAVLSARKDR